jgi:hypothetical protein
MKKNKLWLALIPLALIALACIGIAVYLMVPEDNSETYAETIAQAEQYMDENDYGAAINTYLDAIKLDQENIQAYQGLIEAYTRNGQTDEAIHVRDVYGQRFNTNILADYYSDEIQTMQEELQNLTANDAIDLLAEEKEELAPTTAVELNTSLLAFAAGATYGDYQNIYGASSVEYQNGISTVSYASTPITCVYQNQDGTVAVDNSGKPYSTSTPVSISVKEVPYILIGMVGEVEFSLLESCKDIHNLSIETADVGTVVTFEAYNCTVSIASDEAGNITDTNAWNQIVVNTFIEEEAVTCALSGTVRSATAGTGVEDVNLIFHKGTDSSGDVAGETATDRSGGYEIELEPMEYTVEVSCAGYITEYFDIYINSWMTTESADFVISPELEEGQIRIVLEWGATPRDLDSYLLGTASDGSDVEVYYGSRINSGVAELDVDDMDGYGPETTTIYDIHGTYRFVVSDFNSTGTMGQSEATVKIYMPGESAPTTVSVPAEAQNSWTVCTINDGELEIVNRAD